jgi:uncharacterized protein YeaO (DUF488 family)
MVKSAGIRIKRVYDPPSEDDGLRVLIDRLWPRGLKKSGSHIDLWAKELARTTALRKWFNHEEHKFREFRISYLKELSFRQDIVRKIFEQADNGTITLLFAATNRLHNQAIVLQEFLKCNSKL